MCRGTPEIKMPCCGKLGCKPGCEPAEYPTAKSLEERVAILYHEMFPDYAWGGVMEALDLMRGEILALRTERDSSNHSLRLAYTELQYLAEHGKAGESVRNAIDACRQVLENLQV
jgi:hypothetical protein